MKLRLHDLNTRLGLAALAFSAFLALFAIPNWVFSPSNVQKLILSPTFWPYILSALCALTGVALLFSPAGEIPETEGEAETDVNGLAPWLRLAGLAVLMAATMYALPRLGMVWTSMLAFAGTAFMFRTRYPKAAIVCAIAIPLCLYGFFAHVAGVAIPQGEFVRLP